MAYSPALVAEWHSNPPSARTYDLNGYAPDVVKERLGLSPAKNREMGRANGKTSFRFDLDFTEDCADGRLRVCSHGETTIILDRRERLLEKEAPAQVRDSAEDRPRGEARDHQLLHPRHAVP